MANLPIVLDKKSLKVNPKLYLENKAPNGRVAKHTLEHEKI